MCSSRGNAPGHTIRQILEHLQAAHRDIEVGLSVMTVVELVHGIERAKDEQRRTQRQAFVDELIRDIPVYPVTVEIARRTGSIEGERAAQGVAIAFGDLLIAATAMHLGFAVATSNVRHFQVVPGLTVVRILS